MREWPAVRAPDIVFYLLNSKACDLQAVKCYKSLESYNYVQSGWVGKLFVHSIDSELSYVKGEVSPSQAVSGTPRTAWVCAKRSGEVLTAGCTCMAGQGKVCSHAGAIMWKIDMAVCQGLTTKTCTDRTAAWNSGTKRNVQPAVLEDIDFHLQQRTVDPLPAKRSRPTFVPPTAEEVKKLHEESPFPGLFKIPGTHFICYTTTITYTICGQMIVHNCSYYLPSLAYCARKTGLLARLYMQMCLKKLLCCQLEVHHSSFLKHYVRSANFF